MLQLLKQVDLTTGDDVIDTMFAFAKLRAGESLFRTEKGLVHSPGGMPYYAAVWCNDECEYAAPWFAFTGDEKEAEATVNAFRWYEPFMNDDYLPIPSSIIAQGRDYWNRAGDRGDVAMYLYGLTRFLLTRGELPDEGQKRALNWCKNYIVSLFRAGKTNQAWERLREYSKNRLLGNHVPYAVEAYPEGDMRHLSGESALYCRVITDGLLGLDIDGVFLPSLPSMIKEIKIENVYLNGEYRSVRVK